MTRTAVLFQTHQWNPVVRLRFERLRREIGDRADLFVLMQRSLEVMRALREDPPAGRPAVLFDPTVLPRQLGYPFFRGESVVPGSTHFPLLAFFRERAGYDFYFIIEHDVEFSGHWGELVEQVLRASPDLASSHVRTVKQNPKWFWWTHYHPSQSDRRWALRKRHLRKCFNPVYCISHRALGLIDDAHRQGWRGHYEVLLATILTRRGCKVVDLADLGAFYIGHEQNPRDGLSPAMHSTMRWRPHVSPEEFMQRARGSTLFHPVKGPWLYDGERVIAFPSQNEAQPDQ